MGTDGGIVNQETETVITPYEDGPYLIRGPFRIVDSEGNEIEARREVVALCRCGKSRIRPFCDGTHKLIGFKATGGSERAEAPPAEGFDGVGGSPDPAAGIPDAAAQPTGERQPARNGSLAQPDRRE